MKVYVVLGSDDYTTSSILEIFDSREKAEHAVAKEKRIAADKFVPFHHLRYKLICRQGEPQYSIQEYEVH